MIKIELRDYQQQFTCDIKKQFIKKHRSVLGVLSCGGGKSVIAAMIAKGATDKNNRVLFLVHRKKLCNQITKTFKQCGVNMVLCTVGMVQTITKQINKIPEPSIIIVDEAHHAKAKTYRKIFDAYPESLILGFTATPSDDLDKVFQSLVMSVSTKWLIENQCLSPYRYFSVPVANLTDIHVSRGEYDAKELSEIMENQFIYGETVRNYQLIANNKKTIVYCASVKASKQTAEEFRQHGYAAISLDGAMDECDREQIMQQYENNEYLILCNCELFSEGLDVPDVECVILLRKTKSLTLFIQQSMRAMRYKPNKTAIIIDHVGNIYEHDYPDADREWTLEPKKKKPKEENEIKIKTCPECFTVLMSHIRICDCGYDFSPQLEKEKEIIDMQLQEITALNILKAKPYVDYKHLTTWEELIEFANAKDNIKKKTMWAIYKADELGIDVPHKYDNMRRYMR